MRTSRVMLRGEQHPAFAATDVRLTAWLLNRATAKKFLAASYFLEMLRLFGPLDGEVSAVPRGSDHFWLTYHIGAFFRSKRQ